MTFSVCFRHFRAFDNTGQVSIRPVTLLTGGNSAGKTSFLAALRYLSDLDAVATGGPSFNKDPFFLGSYEQIAHYRGGRHGRSKDFSLTYSGPTPRARVGSRSGSPPSRASFTITFAKRLSQPTLQKISYLWGESAFTLEFDDEWKTATIVAKVEGHAFSTKINAETRFSAEAFIQNPGLIGYYMDAFLSPEEDGKELSNEAQIALNRLGSELRAATSAVPKASYVGAPVRTRPLRTYDPVDTSTQSEGAHVPSQLAQLARSDNSQWRSIREALVAFGKSSGLYSDIEVRSLGRSDSDPFQLSVVINGPKRNIVDVGYGVSQAIPIVFEMVRRPRNTLYIAQQPEVHLHPEAQAALGSLIASEIKRMPGYIVIETHSDYLIDRLRRHIRQGDIQSSDVSLLYFSRSEHVADVHEVKLDEQGEVVDAPDGYRDFFLREQIENLGFDVSDN